MTPAETTPSPAVPAAHPRDTQPQSPVYEAPRVESVLTPDDLEREASYAGRLT